MNNYKRRIFYVPGLISLSLLLISCYIFLFQNNALKEYSVIEVYGWNQYSDLDFGVNPYTLEPKRNYITYQLTGDKNEDAKNLDLAQLQIRKQYHQNDTINGIHFYFDDKVKYWAFVKVFEIAQQDNNGRYMFYKNNVWLFNYPNNRLKLSSCLVMYENMQKTEEELEAERLKRRAFIMKAGQDYWPSELLFILLVVLTFSWLKRIKVISA